MSCFETLKGGDRSRVVRRSTWPLIAIFALSGCVRHLIGPARTEDAYADKARATAEAAQSSVETVLLLVETAGDGDLFDNFARISISEQEDALDGVQSGFRSIQPPDRRSDELRAGLDEVLSAVGGFVDMGDLVANAETGARFDMNLAWVVVVGVVGIVVFAEMSGRVAALCQRPTFDLVRERLGPRFGAANLVASFFINLMTLVAEIAGVSLALSLVSSVNYLFLIPFVAFLVWVVCWRMPFGAMERIFGLLGLCLLVFVVAVWKIGPDWNQLFSQSTQPHIPESENIFTYSYFAIA